MDGNQSSAEAFTFLYDYDYNDSLLVHPAEDDMPQIASSVTAAFYSLIVLISLAGNSFLLWVLVKHKGLTSSANLLLLHLTVSDLVFTLALVPWAVYHVWGWLFGQLACKLLSGTICLGFYSYMMFLTCMTVHRYMAVVHALRMSSLDAHRGRSYTRLTCVVVWILSAGCSLPEVFLSETVNYPDGVLCLAIHRSVEMELTANSVQLLLFFLLPLLIITFCYVQILATLRRSQFRSRERAAGLILCIVVGFFFCWTPYNVAIFLRSLKLLEVESMFTRAWERGLAYAYYITHILAFCHCCFNPLIQIFGGGQFRSYLPSSGGFSRLSERERSQAFSSQSAPHLGSVSGQTDV